MSGVLLEFVWSSARLYLFDGFPEELGNLVISKVNYLTLLCVNKAPGLPLTVGPMGELVKNKDVGCLVAAEEFEGPALDPSAKGGNTK